MTLFKYIRSALFPKTCPICNRLLDDNEELCHTCLRHLPKTEQWTQNDNMTEGLLNLSHHCKRAVSYLYYKKNSDVQKIVHRFKYSDYARPELATFLGQEAASDIIQSDFFYSLDVIIPIPLHHHRLRTRGFNQSEWLAKGLSQITEIPIDREHITREVDNAQQALKTGKSREENVKDIFQVKHPEELYRKNILLVDDVITTGSTLRSCMKTLSICKGCQIKVFILAMAC